MKYFYLDLETTGLDPEKSAICQLACIIECYGKINLEWNILVQPFKEAEIVPEALKVNGLTIDLINAGYTYSSAFGSLKSHLGRYVDCYQRTDKYFMVGYNALAFDDRFLRSMWTRNRDRFYGSWFHWPVLDVAVLAAVYLMRDRHKMKDFKLDTVAEALRVPRVGDAHDALSDVRLTRDIFLKIMEDGKEKL
jgi:DNA polymerase-3 subunit epsilon